MFPSTEDPLSVLEHIAEAERGLYVLCDFGPYLAPFGQEEPLLVRRLRELAWTIKSRPVTVLFVGPTFPEIPALEKEVKTIDLPLPDESEVDRILHLQLDRLRENPDVRAGGRRAHARAARPGAARADRDRDRERAGQGGDHLPRDRARRRCR